ncbi:MAG: PASTA domain-containing protein [Dysgonamonadaceae bacterium]|jgi:beta-lactam-binding protein with PASTA domain|nr:PASTA domain-containing protein [Dysgonamonadaceae bacterium]
MKIWTIINNIFIRNILLAAIVFLLLVFAVLKWLDSYTQYGSQVEIPNVKGMLITDAIPFFEQRSLRYEVIDSAYVKNKAPGSILETTPPIGAYVKQNRIIYITVNAATAQMLIVPLVKDMSQRQAEAMLKSIGFESVTVMEVPGVFKGLALSVEAKGRTLNQGDKLPADTPLTLLVSSGSEGNTFPEESNPQDSLLFVTPDESWF